MTAFRCRVSQARILSFALSIGVLAAGGALVAHDGDTEVAGTLVGVWESVAPLGLDCQTREPFGPLIRTVYTLHQGGTMSEQNTDPIEGPYRTSGVGIWKPTSDRTYTATYGHYGFDPVSRELNAIVKARTRIRLSRDGKSFTENGTFEVFDAAGNPLLDPSGAPIAGCFAATAHRLTF